VSKEKKADSLELSEFSATKIDFPSHSGVTYNKMKVTVMKFVELGGGPFTQAEIVDKMKELGSIKVIAKRVVPFLDSLGFIERSRVGSKGPFNFKLKPELRERLKERPDDFDVILTELCKKSAGYLIIWKYADEMQGTKFTINAFEQYLTNKVRARYSATGLLAWLNALDKVKLLTLDGDFISLESISHPSKIESLSAQQRDREGIGQQTQPPAEGFAPGMTVNVTVNLDYRQPPELQREYMQWLEKLSSKPNVMISVKKGTGETEPKVQKRIDQNS